jgi:hypothetical protein
VVAWIMNVFCKLLYFTPQPAIFSRKRVASNEAPICQVRICHRILLGRSLFTTQYSTLLVSNISGYTDGLRSLINCADLLPL